MSISEIESRREVYSIYTVISQMQHDKKSYGFENMLKRYKDNIEEYRNALPLWEFCAMLAYLEHFDKNFSYDKSVVTEKVIADYDIWCERFLFKEISDEEQEKMLIENEKSAILEFKNRGILLDVIDEVI